VVDSIVGAGDNSLHMVGLPFWANEIYTDATYEIASGKQVILSFSIYVDDFDQSSDGCSGTSVYYWSESGRIGSSVSQRVPGGPLMLGVSGIEAQTDTWYHFTCIADIVNGTEDIFVNGVLVHDDHNLGIVQSDDVRFNRLSMHTGCSSSGEVEAYIDQVALIGDTCPADTTSDGELDVFDVFAYLDLFALGCP
jgi:hypothetical protein